MGETYASWAERNFGAGAPRSLPLEDYDGDNVSNLLEYAFGMDLGGGNMGELPQQTIVVEGGFDYVAIVARINPEAQGITISAEVSNDLITWSSSPADVAPMLNLPTLKSFRGLEAVVSGGPQFIRLSVTMD